MLENYIATYLIDISALIFLCYLIYNNSILDQNRKGPFYLGAVLTVLIILSEAGTILVENGNADLRYLSIIFNVFGFALTPVIPIFLIVIFDANILKTNKLLLLPSILNMFSTVLSPWLGFVFYFCSFLHNKRGNLAYQYSNDGENELPSDKGGDYHSIHLCNSRYKHSAYFAVGPFLLA